MHLLAREEVGLRCLLQVALRADRAPISISTIAAAEGVSADYAAKLLRRLRIGGLVLASRGAQGGYRMARDPHEISVFEALQVLDDAFLPTAGCDCAASERVDCSRTTRCSIQSLWRRVGQDLQATLAAISLADLCSEQPSGALSLPVSQHATART